MIRLKNRFGKANRKEMSWMSDLMETLRQEGISPDLLCAVEEYRAALDALAAEAAHKVQQHGVSRDFGGDFFMI